MSRRALKVGDLVRVTSSGDIGTLSTSRSRGWVVVSLDGREIDAPPDDLEIVHDNPRSVMTGPGWNTARDKLRGAASGARKNPATPEVRAAAIEKYKEFHRYAPKKLTEFPKGFSIPREMVKAGRAKWTTYRSAKVDPSTLQKPRKAVDYIHEHDAGVEVYFEDDAPELEELDVDGETVRVPPEFCDAQALIKLGDSLGFCIKGEDGAEDAEFESSGKLPEIYCTPDGHCLLVIQNQREVLAMIWGGGLGVFSRGIDG